MLHSCGCTEIANDIVLVDNHTRKVLLPYQAVADLNHQALEQAEVQHDFPLKALVRSAGAKRETMMVEVDLASVQRLVAAIKNDRNPQAQREASMIRDRWLAEVDAGLLQMSAEAREALQEA